MILADENIHPKIIAALRDIPVDIISIREEYRGLSDEDIISFAKETNLIILTIDKDFGEWIFAHQVKDVSIVFLRYNQRTEIDDIIPIIKKLIKEKVSLLYNSFTVVTTNKIRSRKI